MKTKVLVLPLVASILSGCAASSTAPAGDSIRQQALNDMQQAKEQGSFPLTEKQFTYPNWPELAHTGQQSTR